MCIRDRLGHAHCSDYRALSGPPRYGLDEPLAGRDTGLPPSHPTLPSLLREAGYGTTLVGKWHLGLLPRYGPLQSGYDHFYGFRGGAVDYFTHSNDLWDEDVKVQQVGYLTDLLGSHAVDVINGYAKAGKPFLLSLHFNACLLYTSSSAS